VLEGKRSADLPFCSRAAFQDPPSEMPRTSIRRPPAGRSPALECGSLLPLFRHELARASPCAELSPPPRGQRYGCTAGELATGKAAASCRTPERLRRSMSTAVQIGRSRHCAARLRRPDLRKASGFPANAAAVLLFHAGWKAEPSSLGGRGYSKRLSCGKAKPFHKSGGVAAGHP
jgi:hypothetical protein